MPDTMQGKNYNRYDLPELPRRGTLRHDGITVPDNSPSSERGGEYQVGPGQTRKPASVTQGPIDPRSFAAVGGHNATL